LKPTQRTTRLPEGRPMVLVSWMSLALAVALLFGLWRLVGGDFLAWQVVGRHTWQHGWPPMVDVFSYTTPGEEFVAHSWLTGLAFYVIEQGVGTVGHAVLRLALVSVALGFALRTARLLGASWPSITLVAPFVLGIMWTRLEYRPHLFTTALLAFQLWLLVSVHLGQRDWRWLWVLVPVYALAINLHGGWVQLPITLAVVGAALVVMRRWGEASHLALVLVACLLALLVNPYGPRLLWFPFEMQADWIRANGSEWQSPWGNPVWRLVGGGRVVSLEPAFWMYLAALAGVLLVRGWRVVDVVPVAVMAFWLVMSLRHLRAVSDAVLLTSPFVAAALPSWRRLWPVGVALTLGLAGIAGAHTYKIWDRPTYATGLGCLAAAVERVGLKGRVHGEVFNHWLLWKFPAIQVSST
jgi:hypothetical protein